MTDKEFSKPYGGMWGVHPDYPSDKWKDEVSSGDTRLGYWSWVQTYEFDRNLCISREAIWKEDEKDEETENLCDCPCHFGGIDGEGVCKQPCDLCECSE